MTARKIRLKKGDINACQQCGSADIATRTYADTVDFRGLEFSVEGLTDSKCQNCGHISCSSDQEAQNNTLIRAAYAAERDRIRAMHGFLAGYEIAKIREHLGLNQREAAALFGGGYNAFNKYESGEVLQSFAMDRLIRLTKAVGKPALAFLRDVNSQPSFTVVPTTSTSTSSVAAFVVAFESRSRTWTQLRNVETTTDAVIGCFSTKKSEPCSITLN